MRLAVPVALLTALALMLPMWLMLPEAPKTPEVPPEMAKMARSLGLKTPPVSDAVPRDQQSQDAFIQRYEAYPFGAILGTGGYSSSMRTWFEDVYGDSAKRLGAANERELPQLLQRSAEAFHEQAERTLLWTIAGLLIALIATPVGLTLMRWKANQTGRYAYKGTIATFAMSIAAPVVAILAPFAGSRGELASAVLCMPVIDFWIVYYIVSKRRNARMPSDPGAAGPPTPPASPTPPA